MSALFKIFSFAATAAVGGALVGGMASLNDGLEDNAPRHRDFRSIEKYNGELVSIILDVGIMKDRFAPSYFAMHKALVKLLDIFRHLRHPNFPKKLSWTAVASSYNFDVDQHADLLLAHIKEYPEHEAMLRKNITTIKNVAKQVNANIGELNDEIHGPLRNEAADPYPIH